MLVACIKHSHGMEERHDATARRWQNGREGAALTCIGGVHQAQPKGRHCLDEKHKVNMRHVGNEMKSIEVHSTDVK